MKKILLSAETGNFYKGNMHCHSTNSDGKNTPEELKEMYKEKGYNFLAITDHERIINYSYLDDKDFITITSGEYAIKEFSEQSTLKNRNMKVCHLNLYAKEQINDNSVCYNDTFNHFVKDPVIKKELLERYGNYERIYGADGINEIIRIANENGFFVCYNHPRWSLENYGEYSEYEGLWGVEIFNTSCNRGGLYEYNINVFDDFLRDGKKVYASCGDDNHSPYSAFGAFVMVNTEELTYENIINALLNGNFYSSTGPEIFELYVDGNFVHIKCSDAKHITYSTRGRRSAIKNADKDSCITEATFEIQDIDEYFRLDVIDEYGRRANTQAYYINLL